MSRFYRESQRRGLLPPPTDEQNAEHRQLFTPSAIGAFLYNEEQENSFPSLFQLNSMQRFAFKMKLKPGFREEYKKRHSEIWPELVRLLKEAGISDYSIFLDEETNTLFGVQKQEGKSSQDLGSTAVVQKWWAYMADIMETNPDNSPLSVPLKELFHLD